MNSAAKTGGMGAKLADHEDLFPLAVRACNLKQISKGIPPTIGCTKLAKWTPKWWAATKTLGAYGKEMKALAEMKDPGGEKLAKAVLEEIDAEELDDDATGAISGAVDSLVKAVSAGYRRTAIRSVVRDYEGAVHEAIRLLLTQVWEQLHESYELDRNACDALARVYARPESLEDDELRFSWPMGAQLARIENHQTRIALAKFEKQLVAFSLAHLALERWAAGEKNDKKTKAEIKRLSECSKWDKRIGASCLPALDELICEVELTANSARQHAFLTRMKEPPDSLPSCEQISEALEKTDLLDEMPVPNCSDQD